MFCGCLECKKLKIGQRTKNAVWSHNPFIRFLFERDVKMFFLGLKNALEIVRKTSALQNTQGNKKLNVCLCKQVVIRCHKSFDATHLCSAGG